MHTQNALVAQQTISLVLPVLSLKIQDECVSLIFSELNNKGEAVHCCSLFQDATSCSPLIIPKVLEGAWSLNRDHHFVQADSLVTSFFGLQQGEVHFLTTFLPASSKLVSFLSSAESAPCLTSSKQSFKVWKGCLIVIVQGTFPCTVNIKGNENHQVGNKQAILISVIPAVPHSTGSSLGNGKPPNLRDGGWSDIPQLFWCWAQAARFISSTSDVPERRFVTIAPHNLVAQTTVLLHSVFLSVFTSWQGWS